MRKNQKRKNENIEKKGKALKKSYKNPFQDYSVAKFQKDLISGITVGVIAIPLAMAFAIASGVKPEYGIYTTIIAGIIISLFGGSRFQIGGPTGAFVPILLGIVLTYGYFDLLLAGFMAGIILCLMGLFKLGNLIKFIPLPVIVGFTAGIAVIIFTGQIANFLGLTDVEKHEKFIDNMKEIIIHISSINGYSITIAIICLITILATTRFLPKIPSALTGLLISTLVAFFFFGDKVPTIGSVYNGIPESLPKFEMLEISWERMESLIGPAFVIACLGAIESLLSAVVADGMTKTKHNSNRELVGQGLANIVTPFFGGIPATGAIARTATNIKSGAVSRVSGVIHGLFVLLTLLLLAPFASAIPLASMAPILMVVAWNMSEKYHFVHLCKQKNGDTLVLLLTFLLTIFTSLTLAVEVGLVLSVILFIKQTTKQFVTEKVLPDHSHEKQKLLANIVNDEHDCPQVHIYTIEGPLFFGAANTFEDQIMKQLQRPPKIVILRVSKMPFMDSTGESTFRNIIEFIKSENGVLLLSGAKPKLIETLKTNGLYEEIGAEHFFNRTGEAIDYSLTQLNINKCIGCQHFAFRECQQLSQAGS